jgi:hypothetical protein
MFGPITVFIDAQHSRRLEFAECKTPRDRVRTIGQFYLGFEPPSVVEGSHLIGTCFIVEGDQSEGLESQFAVSFGSANAFNHQHESVEFELRRFSLRKLCKLAGPRRGVD